VPSVDFVAANRLLAMSLDRSRRPGSDQDHRELLGRFRTDPGYATAVREAAEPLGLRVLGVDPQLGLLLDTTADSPFALRTEDLLRDFKWSSASERVIYGLALVGIATFCYPTAASFNEPGVRQVTALEVDDWIRKAAESAQHQTEQVGEQIGPADALATYVTEKAVSHNRSSDALRQDCTVYKVGRLLRWLAERGFLVRDPGDKELFRTTERFRLHVREVAANAVFDAVQHATRGDVA